LCNRPAPPRLSSHDAPSSYDGPPSSRLWRPSPQASPAYGHDAPPSNATATCGHDAPPSHGHGCVCVGCVYTPACDCLCLAFAIAVKDFLTKRHTCTNMHVHTYTHRLTASNGNAAATCKHSTTTKPTTVASSPTSTDTGLHRAFSLQCWWWWWPSILSRRSSWARHSTYSSLH